MVTAAVPDRAAPRWVAPHSEPVGRIARLATVVVPLLVAGVALVLARQTMLPGLGFWDTAEFQAVPPVLGTLHPTGFPAYTVLGWLANVVLAPAGEPAFRMNLFGAICVAGAVALAVVLVRQLTSRLWLGAAAGLTLFLAPITWEIAGRADAHSLHLFLLAALLVLLVAWERRVRALEGPRDGADRWLIAAAAVFALAVANHSLILLAAPGVALYVLAVDPTITRRRSLLARCLGVSLVIVVAFYAELPIRAAIWPAPLTYGNPGTLDGFLYVVLAQQFRGSLGAPLAEIPKNFATFVDLVAAQLGPLAPVVPFAGIVAAAARPRFVLLTAPTLILTCLFAIFYSNADIDRYYLGPLLVAVTWLAILLDVIVRAAVAAVDGLGSAASVRRIRIAETSIAIGASIVFVAPSVLAAPRTWRAVDQSHAMFAQDWVDEVFGELEPNAIVLSWWSYSTPLWYEREVEGKRRDVTIIDDRTRLDEDLGDVTTVIDSYLGRRPVYVIRPYDEMPALDLRYVLQPLPDSMHAGLTLVVQQRPTGDR